MRLNYLYKYSILLEILERYTLARDLLLVSTGYRQLFSKHNLLYLLKSHSIQFSSVCPYGWWCFAMLLIWLGNNVIFRDWRCLCYLARVVCNSPVFISKPGNKGFYIQQHLCIQKLLLFFDLSLLTLEAWPSSKSHTPAGWEEKIKLGQNI